MKYFYHTNMKRTNRQSNSILYILLTGLLVGTLDIVTAFADYFIATGKAPDGVLKFIASGVFGDEAFSGGTGIVLMGLLFHFIIAYSFTVLFFLIYPQIKFLQKNRIITGIVYGIFIWMIMNLIVVPLSNTPSLSMKAGRIIKSMLILIVMVGLALSFIAHKFFSAVELKEK